MLSWLMKRRLDAFERDTGYDVTYMREMLAADVNSVMLNSILKQAGLKDQR